MSGSQKIEKSPNTLKKGGPDSRYSLPLDSEANTENSIPNQGKKHSAMRSMGVTQIADNYALDQLNRVGLTINKVNNGVADGSHSSRKGSRSPREIGSSSKS
jgi:hypothetical protein